MYETPIEIKPPKPEAYVDIELAKLAERRLRSLLTENQDPKVKDALDLLSRALKKTRKLKGGQ